MQFVPNPFLIPGEGGSRSRPRSAISSSEAQAEGYLPPEPPPPGEAAGAPGAALPAVLEGDDAEH